MSNKKRILGCWKSAGGILAVLWMLCPSVVLASSSLSADTVSIAKSLEIIINREVSESDSVISSRTDTINKNSVLRRTTVYAGDYEEVSTGSTIFGYCYLGDGVIALTVDGGTPYIGYAYTDNLGSILTAVSTDGTVVYNADYDAWGRQNVTSDYVGYHRGYCGHEMMPEFGLINMNGRLYDLVLGRFLSPDNYVQMPDFSQNFNRYSYCLNNPLKYTDPSGELFGIDDAIIAFALYNAASSMMQAAYNGESVWKAGGLSLLSSAASYGIGEAFGSVGSFGKELFRARAHGLAGGAISALGGGSFLSGFSSSALASGIGSFAQGVNMNQALMVATTTAMGAIGAWATGGDWVEGAMQGLNIGLLNHAVHDGEIWYTKKGENYYEAELPEVKVYHPKKRPVFRPTIVEQPLRLSHIEFYAILLARNIPSLLQIVLKSEGNFSNGAIENILKTTSFRQLKKGAFEGEKPSVDLISSFHELARQSRARIITKNGYSRFETDLYRVGVHQSTKGGGPTLDIWNKKTANYYKIRYR